METTSTTTVGKTAREFSRCGPCIPLGTIVRETKTQWVIEHEINGTSRRRKGSPTSQGVLHAEPCSSCCDHAQTHYPHGYCD